MSDDQTHWVAFCRKAQEAAELSLPKPIAQGLIGAMREIEENVHLHSERSQDGIVGYRGTEQEFEFVIADSGIGILNSLRTSPDYAHLSDAGSAIKTALSDGESRLRYASPGRGFGFRDLFVGLANLNGELRFRSGDHALTIDGTSPSLITARLSQKVEIPGFLAGVVCGITPRQTVH
jgi:anti-sigma regulatory factor (Ser/Thr protein kinase)